MKNMPILLCFLTDNVAKIRNAVKQVWPKDDGAVYLCAFHVIKYLKKTYLEKKI